MVTVTFLIVSFIILAIVVGILIFYIIRLISFVDTPPPQPDPNTVACSPDNVLQAWIENIPNRTACPAFTNNYVIDTDQIKMFEKNFQVDPTNNCCYYSNSKQQRSFFPNPWICISRTDGEAFTLSQLNEKPYTFNDNKVGFIIPPCEKKLSECIGLIRFDTNTTDLKNPIGLYKLFLFSDQKNSLTDPSLIPSASGCADYKDAPFEDVVFQIGESCDNLRQVDISGNKVVEFSNGRAVYICNREDLPTYVQDIVDLFNEKSKRFFPIAGANPQLSENAANN